jgi:hypothetical protein
MHRPARRPRSSQIERDLARLADGTLDPSRRRRVEQLVARFPELEARLREQCRSVAATQTLARLERAPLALRMQHQALFRRRRAPAVALGAVGAAGAAGALVWTLAALGGGQAAPTVAQAETIATRAATTSVGEPPDDQVTLPGLQAAGVPFPYWEDRFDWHATGTRTDRLDGRLLTTVFYRRGAERTAYTIVSGNPLAPVAAAYTTVRGGTVLAGSWSGGRPVVTWLRRGHTCVLSGGRGVSLGALTQLAGWRSHGRIPF